MRGLILAGLLLFPALAQAQQPRTVDLKLQTDDAMLIVETLGQIACPNVRALSACERAVALVKEIQRQVRAEEK